MAFMDSIGGYSSSVMSYATTTAFWILLILCLIVVFFLILFIRRSRKLNKFVLELYDLGDGRFDYKLTKGGWFKSYIKFNGLWDSGSENRFRTKDMTPIDNVSHNDYRYFNGKQCLTIIRNPHDPKIAFPISRFFISKDSRAIMAEVAPADFRDSAAKAIEATNAEMASKWAQYAPLIITGIVIMISLIITLLNTQYGKYMVDKATELILELRNTPCSSVASGAP